MQYPKAEILFEPLFPLLQAYQAIPYASFSASFALYSAMVRNPSFSRFVRFNAMQTVVLDVLLVLPLIIQRISNPRRGLGFNILVMSYNAVFLFLVLGFLYARVSSMQRESSHDPTTRPPLFLPRPSIRYGVPVQAYIKAAAEAISRPSNKTDTHQNKIGFNPHA